VTAHTPADVAASTPPVPAPHPSGVAGDTAAGGESSDAKRSPSGGHPQTRRARMSVPAVKVQTSAFLPPVDALRAAVGGVTPGAERVVWLVSGDGTLLHPMGQTVTTAQEVAEQATHAAVLIEQGTGADFAILLVGNGARDEETHVRALVEALGRSHSPQDVPGRGPYAEVSR